MTTKDDNQKGNCKSESLGDDKGLEVLASGLWFELLGVVAGGEVLGEDVGLQEVLLAGGQGDGVGAYVGGLDADHRLPGVRGHVGELGGELGPGVPDDGGLGVGFVEGDAATVDGVVEVHAGFGVEIGAVDGAGEFEKGLALVLALEVVGLVQEVAVGETDD